eukprot:COSAG01_NODE_4257_length_5203_cov_10.296630_6_plen_182_part_00
MCLAVDAGVRVSTWNLARAVTIKEVEKKILRALAGHENNALFPWLTSTFKQIAEGYVVSALKSFREIDLEGELLEVVVPVARSRFQLGGHNVTRSQAEAHVVAQTRCFEEQYRVYWTVVKKRLQEQAEWAAAQLTLMPGEGSDKPADVAPFEATVSCCCKCCKCSLAASVSRVSHGADWVP